MREARRCPRCTALAFVASQYPEEESTCYTCGHVQYLSPPDLSTPFTEREDGRIRRAQADWAAIKAEAERVKTAAAWAGLLRVSI